MLHLVAHAVPGTLLFRDWTEAHALWQRLARVTGVRALVLMPDHVHLVRTCEDPGDFGIALQAFARWRSRWRGRAGLGDTPSPPQPSYQSGLTSCW